MHFAKNKNKTIHITYLYKTEQTAFQNTCKKTNIVYLNNVQTQKACINYLKKKIIVVINQLQILYT